MRINFAGGLGRCGRQRRVADGLVPMLDVGEVVPGDDHVELILIRVN